MMPCVYDDVPGSWATQSEGWPSIHDPEGVARKLVIQNKLVPYGSYVTVDGRLRLETPEYVERVRAALEAATPNPVRAEQPLPEYVQRYTNENLARYLGEDAEQPCTCPQHPDDVIPCPRHRAEQPDARGVEDMMIPAVSPNGSDEDMLKYLDELLAAQGTLMFARGNYNEDQAECFGVAILDFMRLYGMRLRAKLAAPTQEKGNG